MYNITKGDHSVYEYINEEFTNEELRLIIRKIKKMSKACGIDHIGNEFLKACPHKLKDDYVEFKQSIIEF